MSTLCAYEIFLQNGTSFTIRGVSELKVTVTDRKITNLSISGSGVKDTLVYLNIDDIICIVKRGEYTESGRWWRRNVSNLGAPNE